MGTTLALSCEEPPKLAGVFDVIRPLIPLQFVDAGYCCPSGLLLDGLPDASYEMAVYGLFK
jgi:hypothetical protein